MVGHLHVSGVLLADSAFPPAVLLQVFQAEGLIYMVQEYGEIDLARLLAKHDAARRAATGTDAAHGGLLKDNLDENFIRLYWQQMLQVSLQLRLSNYAGVMSDAVTAVVIQCTGTNKLLIQGRLLSGVLCVCRPCLASMSSA